MNKSDKLPMKTIRRLLLGMTLCIICNCAAFAQIQISAIRDELNNDFLKTVQVRPLSMQKITVSAREVSDDIASFDSASYKRTESAKQQLLKEVHKYTIVNMPDDVRNRYLRYLSDQRNWSEYIRYYKTGRTSTSLVARGRSKGCIRYIRSDGTVVSIKNSTHTQKQVISMNPRQECDRIIAQARMSGYLNEDLIWKRFSLAMMNDDITLANYLMNEMDRKKLDAQRWLNFYHNPTLLSNFNAYQDNINTQILIHVLAHYAKNNPDDAVRIATQLKLNHVITAEQMSSVYIPMVMKSAAEGDINANNQLKLIAPGFRDALLYRSMAKLALKKQDWNRLIDYVDAMPFTEKRSGMWQYWKAQAYIKLNQRSQALPILKVLAGQRSYYGFLAAYETNTPIKLNHRNYDIPQSEVDAIRNSNEFVKIEMLYRNGFIPQARARWFSVIQDFNDRQKYIAAKIAQNWRWYDVAILTMKNNESYADDVEIRFPILYGRAVKLASQKFNIDPALVMAVIRQESCFRQDAQSTVGARGLMQLMPTTAYLYYDRLKYTDKLVQNLYNSDRNIHIGTAHLAGLDREFAQLPMQIAAYNAGSGWVVKWMRSNRVSDIRLWIELIPWEETRNYVKQVLTYQKIYQLRLAELEKSEKLTQTASNTAN